MSLLSTIESLSNNIENNLISNVTIEKSFTESYSSLNSNHVNIRFTIALAVPAGKF
jgi:hypothetical protein